MAVSDVPQAASTPAVVAPAFGAGIADPGPLGLGAFAMTTFFLSSVNAGWIPKSVEPVVLGLAAFALTTFVLSVFNAGLLSTASLTVLGVALFYGGIVQVFAGMWEFAKGNTFGALAFSSYGAFWLSYCVSLLGLASSRTSSWGLWDYLVFVYPTLGLAYSLMWAKDSKNRSSWR